MFFLYLMGDAFFRWDGFRFYATFREFLPSVALVSVLWFSVAFFTAFLFSIAFKGLKSLNSLKGFNVTIQNYLLFIISFLISGLAAWLFKRKVLHLGITIQITLLETAFALTTAVIATWLFRHKAVQLTDLIQNRITPLFWLYMILVILAVPYATYHSWGDQSDIIQQENSLQSATEAINKPNIILVTFDALSARNMSVYGYQRKTTPFIDEWAEKASIFTRLEAAGTFTALTTASLMTGKRAWTHNVFQLHSFDTLNSDVESIPVLMRKAGYYTMALTPSQYSHEIVKSIGKSGFDFAPRFHEFMSSNSLHGHINAILAKYFDGKIIHYKWITQGDFILGELLILSNRYRNNQITDRPPEKVFNRFLSHMSDHLQEPFFAWIHLKPPHYPYLPPEPYIGSINPSPKLRGRLDQYNVFLLSDSYKKGKIPLDEVQPQVELLRDRYDEFIMYCDKQFEEFITRLNAMDKAGETIVLLSTDHGQIFTPDAMGHGGPPREDVTHIPLIIREANQNKQNIINNLVEQIDIPSTILELAGIQLPSWMEGRSLVPLMRGQKSPDKPAFAGDFQSNPSGQAIQEGIVAAWEGDYKLVHDLKSKKSELFNIRQDRDEQNNLIDKEPAIGQHLLGLVMDEINKANEAVKRKQTTQ